MKPILFNTEMVRALLEGRKTVTRRVVKPQPKSRLVYTCMGSNHGTWCYPSKTVWESWGEEYRLPSTLADADAARRWNPPYHSGDILYVRETWCKVGNDVDKLYFDNDAAMYDGMYLYKADGIDLTDIGKWNPSIHMPKEAARLFLRVTNVQVARLQDMNGEQAYMEGAKAEVPPILEALESGDKNIFPKYFDKFSAEKKEDWYRRTATATYIAQCELTERLLKAFKSIWNKTIKAELMATYGWEANPWV